MTIFSPYTVGSVATRRSMARPETRIEMRPSCGTRRSAMLMSAMTLRRLMTPFWMLRGERMTSCSTPSMRNRMRRSCSVGSTWMSDARSCVACVMSMLTNLTIGASSTTSARLPRSVSSVLLVGGGLHDRVDVAVDPVEVFDRLHDLRRSGRRPSSRRRRSIARMSSTANTFDGSAMATTSRPSSQATGMAW